MTEIKPGRWRLKDGREVVVLSDTGPYGWLTWIVHENSVNVRKAKQFEGAEYLGPAVIGEATPYDTAYWVMLAREAERQCKELEAETVATRELLEKSEERCEELAKELEVFRDTINSLSCENRRLKRGELTAEEFQELCHGLSEDDMGRFKEGCIAYWEKIAGPQSVEYSWENGVETWRFRSFTVMVRGNREALCYVGHETNWVVLIRRTDYPHNHYEDKRTREEAEAWCREQLEPRWREATEGDRGKACRVRDDEEWDWRQGERLIHIIDHEFRFVVDKEFDPSYPVCYKFCEVRE